MTASIAARHADVSAQTPYVLAVETALPAVSYGNAAIAGAAKQWLARDPEHYELFLRFLDSSLTESRHFVLPPEHIVGLHSQRAKAELFEELGPPLAIQAAERALHSAGIPAEQVGAIILTSCSCPVIPSLDTYVIDALGIPRDVVRLPSYQFGCAGGVIGLTLAGRFAASVENVLIICVELCSLVMQPENHGAAHLVGAAIFGDGAAAALISNKAVHSRRGSEEVALVPSIVSHRSHLLPETRHLMGYDLFDSGAHLRLDKELPKHLVETVPVLVDSFLWELGLTRKDIPWWLFHPGGTKILNLLAETLELRPEQCPWSSDVLREVGNLSSAAILFVLQRFLESGCAKREDLFLVVGVGPGLTIELVLGRLV